LEAKQGGETTNKADWGQDKGESPPEVAKSILGLVKRSGDSRSKTSKKHP